MKHEFKNIIFDLDGTLVNSNPSSLKSLQQTLIKVENKFFSIKDLEIILGLPDFDAFKILNVKNEMQCYSVWKKLSKEFDEDKVVFPGIIEMLSQLKNKSLNLGIVTSREKERYYDDPIVIRELNSFFEIVVTADLTKEHKPSHEPLTKWLELSKALPHETIYIGDTENDYISAKSAGISFGLATWGLHQEIKTMLSFNKPCQVLELF